MKNKKNLKNQLICEAPLPGKSGFFYGSKLKKINNMEKVVFTPDEDFDKDVQEFEQWLEEKNKEPKLQKTDEQLYACSWEDLILHVKQLYAVIEEQEETIQGWRDDFQ